MVNRKYNIVYINYFGSQQIDVPKTANGYVAINRGDTLVTVNGLDLLPRLATNLSGESTGVQGNADEIFVGNNGSLQIVFTPGGGVSKVVIGWKFYIDEVC